MPSLATWLPRGEGGVEGDGGEEGGQREKEIFPLHSFFCSDLSNPLFFHLLLSSSVYLSSVLPSLLVLFISAVSSLLSQWNPGSSGPSTMTVPVFL